MSEILERLEKRVACQVGKPIDLLRDYKLTCAEAILEIKRLEADLTAANKLRHDQILYNDKALTVARDTGEGFRQELLRSVGDRRCELLAHEFELAEARKRLELAAFYVQKKWGAKALAHMNDVVVKTIALAKPTGDHP